MTHKCRNMSSCTATPLAGNNVVFTGTYVVISIVCSGLIWLGIDEVAGCCVYGNELLGSKECW